MALGSLFQKTSLLLKRITQEILLILLILSKNFPAPDSQTLKHMFFNIIPCSVN